MKRRHFLHVLGGIPVLAACGGAQTSTRFDVLKIPDERTARAWIVKAFKKEGYAVELDRTVKLGKDAAIVVDVAAKDDVWGVAWLRADEQQALKGKLPPAPAGVSEGALWVHHGEGDDADQRFLILMEKAYEYDPDPRGEGGIVRSIEEVEARCVRDVTDYLVRAKAGQIE
jgi:hypothetical protein